MLINAIIRTALGVSAGVLFSSTIVAAPIYDMPATMSGSRSVVAGELLTTAGNWSQAVITWTITDNGDLTYTYVYELSGFGPQPSISYLVLDLSPDAIDYSDNTLADPGAITATTIDGTLLPSPFVEFGDKDGILGGVKFDQGTEEDSVIYSFVSNRLPVWGDLFVKGGQFSLTNAGFGDRTSTDPLDYIARPNGVIPEPGGLLAAAAAGALLLRRRRM